MATPYLQFIEQVVPSTQDLARDDLEVLPRVVIASGQTEGRGRSGASWANADRALAVSVAWKDSGPQRPVSLMAGVAAIRSLGDSVSLKWPNDLLLGDSKLGGILVERSGDVVVTGLGLNLYWKEPPAGVASLADEDPGEGTYREVGALWAAELLSMVESEGWPIDEYIEACATLGRTISWEPNGRGIATGIGPAGALIVSTDAGIDELHAGAVRHIRS